jgi:phosphoadenosine phosphosulfate reductase
MTGVNIESVNRRLENYSPNEILEWAWNNFGPSVAMTSSFQTQSLPLLHMISQTAPELPVLFIDTGFHFPETLAYRDQIVELLDINLQIIKPKVGIQRFKKTYGDLYRTDPDLCCYMNKIQPLNEALKGFNAWISGIRRDQTLERANTKVIARQDNGRYKISPMVRWTRADIWKYVNDHDLPNHPLLSQGFLSIGCAPCTKSVLPGEGERSGRWPGSDKTECGLHTSNNFDELKE